MLSTRELEARFQEILETMDGIAASVSGEAGEALKEMNAELEDAIFMLSEIAPEDLTEELPDALEEFEALAGDYARLAKDIPEVIAPAQRLAAFVRMAKDD